MWLAILIQFQICCIWNIKSENSDLGKQHVCLFCGHLQWKVLLCGLICEYIWSKLRHLIILACFKVGKNAMIHGECLDTNWSIGDSMRTNHHHIIQNYTQFSLEKDQKTSIFNCFGCSNCSERVVTVMYWRWLLNTVVNVQKGVCARNSEMLQ